MTTRRKRIVELLEQANDYLLTSAQLSSELNVSSKTIRNDIKELNSQLREYGIYIEAIRGKGYVLKAENKEGLHDFFQSYTDDISTRIPKTSEERTMYLLETFLYSTQYIKIDDLCEELFVSRSTLQNNLNSVRDILKKYDLFLEQKPHYGIKIKGKESSIRFCISEYIFNQTPLTMEPQWLSILSKKEFEIIRESILKQLREHRIVISDISFHNLLTHLIIAYKRIFEQKPVQMMKREYKELKSKKEYKVAEKILDDIEHALDVHFPNNEVAYLSIHLQGTKLASSMNGEKDFDSLIDHEVYALAKDLIHRIEQFYNLGISKDQQLLINLSLHLKPAINRYHYNMNIRNPMLEEIKLKFPLSFEAALTGAEVIYERYDFEVNEDEVAYIALHLEAAREKAKGTSPQRKKCLIVCASGLGSAQLLFYKIENELGHRIHVVGTTEYYNLSNENLEDIDFIISTIPIEQELGIPVIQVSTILGESDLSLIENKIENRESSLHTYITPRNTFLNQQFNTPEEIIRFLTKKVIKDNQASDHYTDSVLEREAQAPTSFGNLVALPHPLEPGTNQTFLSILTLEKPIDWGEKHVQLVILLNVNRNKKDDLKPMFKSLVRLIDNKDAIYKLIESHTFEEIEHIIKNI